MTVRLGAARGRHENEMRLLDSVCDRAMRQFGTDGDSRADKQVTLDIEEVKVVAAGEPVNFEIGAAYRLHGGFEPSLMPYVADDAPARLPGRGRGRRTHTQELAGNERRQEPERAGEALLVDAPHHIRDHEPGVGRFHQFGHQAGRDPVVQDAVIVHDPEGERRPGHGLGGQCHRDVLARIGDDDDVAHRVAAETGRNKSRDRLAIL